MICVFTYDHEHRKTQDGLFAMWLNGYVPQMVWAAPWKDNGKSFDFCYHPQKIAKRMGVEYVVAPHNEPIDHGCELGVILGARILPQRVIDSFPRGIINIHPGRLPENGGLNAYMLEWLSNGPAIVTAHYIDKYVDRGVKILEREFEKPATFEAFVNKMNAEQMPTLIEALG